MRYYVHETATRGTNPVEVYDKLSEAEDCMHRLFNSGYTNTVIRDNGQRLLKRYTKEYGYDFS